MVCGKKIRKENDFYSTETENIMLFGSKLKGFFMVENNLKFKS